MNQVAELLRQTITGFLALTVFYHLYRGIKWLLEKDHNRTIRKIGVRPKGSSIRNGQVDPR
jgi:hypothetical protein